MKINYDFILNIISILSTGTTFFSFIVTTLLVDTKSPDYIEYTSLSKFFLNLYIFLILLLCFIDSIYPKIICDIVKENFSIFTNVKGKIIITIAIDIMYYCTDNLPPKLFGMITFVSALALFLGNLVFNCEILKQQPMEEDNTNKTLESNNSNNSFSVVNK